MGGSEKVPGDYTLCNKIVLDWAPSSSNKKAFEDEDTRTRNDGGVDNPMNYSELKLYDDTSWHVELHAFDFIYYTDVKQLKLAR